MSITNTTSTTNTITTNTTTTTALTSECDDNPPKPIAQHLTSNCFASLAKYAQNPFLTLPFLTAVPSCTAHTTNETETSDDCDYDSSVYNCNWPSDISPERSLPMIQSSNLATTDSNGVVSSTTSTTTHQ